MPQNPARELHDLLTEWGRTPGSSIFKNRGSARDAPSSGMWTNALRGTRLLDEIRQGLRRHGLLEANQVTVDAIASKLFQPQAQWSQSGNHQLADPQQLGSLMSWAFILDHDAPQLTLDESHIAEVRDAIQEARTILDSVPGMNEAYRTYIGDLLVAVLGSLGGEKPDLVSARAKFHEAVGAMLFQPEVRKSPAGREFIKKLAVVGGIFLISNVGVPIGTTIAADVGSALMLEQMSTTEAVDSNAVMDGEVAEDD